MINAVWGLDNIVTIAESEEFGKYYLREDSAVMLASSVDGVAVQRFRFAMPTERVMFGERAGEITRIRNYLAGSPDKPKKGISKHKKGLRDERYLEKHPEAMACVPVKLQKARMVIMPPEDVVIKNGLDICLTLSVAKAKEEYFMVIAPYAIGSFVNGDAEKYANWRDAVFKEMKRVMPYQPH